MSIKLHSGVRLTVLPTTKYKTVRIFVRFTARQCAKNAAKRTLLTSLLETNSLNFPTQTQLSSRLAELYGASFGINVNKKGNLHQISVGMTIVNGKYVADEALFPQAIDFLQEVLFQPNIQAGKFDEETFLIEKNNLISYLQSIKEDRQTYASLKLQELYFSQDTNQRTASFGQVIDLEEVTAEEMAAIYQQMITEDQVDIFVVGDISEEKAQQAIQQLPFAPRKEQQLSVFYKQPATKVVKEKIEHDDVTQAKLNLGYATDVYYDEEQKFSLMVFNGLFGGFPHSKLFMNVREKESLAYYASSSIDTFRGFLSVQTGIDGQQRDRVLALVEKQLQSLQKGEITSEELAQTKAMLKNQYLLSLDNPQALIETEYLNQWVLHSEINKEQFMEKLAAVTKKDVQRIAQQLKLQAIFFLDKE